MAAIANYIDKVLQGAGSRENDITLGVPPKNTQFAYVSNAVDEPLTSSITLTFVNSHTGYTATLNGIVSSDINDTSLGYTQIDGEFKVNGSTVWTGTLKTITNSATPSSNYGSGSHDYSIGDPGGSSITCELIVTKISTGIGSGSFIDFSSIQITSLH
jgi:hypothetical protein